MGSSSSKRSSQGALRLNRRDALSTAATLSAAAALPAWWTSPARAQAAANPPEKLLFVVAAAGGASISDSFLPVMRSEVSTPELAAGLITQPNQLVTQPNGSNIRCVQNRGGSVAELPAGFGLDQSEFLARHAADTAVMTAEVTSVNHRVAQKRALTGANANRGRTIMEAMAAQHGNGRLLPNCNMAQDGYIEAGDDVTLPPQARAEPIADPRTFPLATHGTKGILTAPTPAEVTRARGIRDRLDAASPFGHTFADAPVRQRYLAQRGRVEQMEELDLITRLMAVGDQNEYPIEAFGLENAPIAQQVLAAFPDADNDAFQAKAALAFLLARSGATTAVTLAPSFAPTLAGASITNTPLAFDFSHVDHYGVQNLMWSRILLVVDGLISLLKSEPVGDTGTSLWDRSLIYIATDFGREKIRPNNSEDFGTAHSLNNGFVLVSPLLNGNRVYGGIDPDTLLTYGFDPVTGDPAPATVMREEHVYGAVAQALDIEFEDRVDIPCMMRS